ncbi:MAG: gliding motility-associated C-terminal domain-containing protein [Saprospiraceae bacterium]|nr:gliding motility-associated C-terminal domain-containing protein [Saprospiraceae bacterium]
MGKSIYWLALAAGLFWGQVAPAQTITLSLPDTSVLNGTTLALDITCTDFDSIVSMQFSINWNTSVLDYQSFERIDLDYVAIGDFQADDGELRFSWFDVEGFGQSLPDGSVVVRLIFEVVGTPGSFTLLPITDTPLAIQIFTAGSMPGLYDPVALQQDTGRVEVISPADVDVSVTSVRCFGENNGAIDVTIADAPSGYSLQWTGPGNFTADTEDLAGLEAGDYTLFIRDQDGQVIYQVTYTIVGPALLVLESLDVTDAFCEEPVGSLITFVSGGVMPYSLDIGNGPVAVTQLSGLVAGNYDLTIADANGCRVDTSFVIGGPVSPTVNLSDTTTFCTGLTGLLEAGDHSSYQWSTGETTPEISVTDAGAYSVTVTSSEGCQAADTTLVVFSSDVNLSFSNIVTLLCQGDSLQLQVSGASTYTWIDTSGTLSALDTPFPYAKPQVTTTYTVIGVSSCGTDTASIEVEVYPVTATAGPDTCIGRGVPLQLYASGGEFYQWADAEYPVSNPFIPNPMVEPEDSIDYIVTIVDSNACVIRDTISVMVGTNPLDITRINLITPNDDGKNDGLDFGSIGKYGPNSLRVYNRWGDLVYQKVNYQSDDERFDGTSKGQPLPAGTYYYVLAFKTGAIKQALTIVR